MDNKQIKTINIHNNTVKRNLNLITKNGLNNTSSSFEEINLNQNAKVKFTKNSRYISDVLQKLKDDTSNNTNNGGKSLYLNKKKLELKTENTGSMSITNKSLNQPLTAKNLRKKSTDNCYKLPELKINNDNENLRNINEMPKIFPSKSIGNYSSNLGIEQLTSCPIDNLRQDLNISPINKLTQQDSKNINTSRNIEKIIPKLDMKRIATSISPINFHKIPSATNKEITKEEIKSARNLLIKDRLESTLKKDQSKNDISHLFSNTHRISTSYSNALLQFQTTEFGNSLILNNNSNNNNTNKHVNLVETLNENKKFDGGNIDLMINNTEIKKYPFHEKKISNISNILNIDKTEKSKSIIPLSNQYKRENITSDSSSSLILQHRKSEETLQELNIHLNKLAEIKLFSSFQLDPNPHNTSLQYFPLNKKFGINELMINLDHKKEENLYYPLNSLLIPRMIDIHTCNTQDEIYKSLISSEEYANIKKDIPSLLSNVQASRNDLILLTKYVNNRIKAISDDKAYTDEEKTKKIDEIYNIIMNELIRQIALDCYERGKIFYCIWSTYVMYLKNFKDIIQEKVEEVKDIATKEYNRVFKTFKDILNERNQTIDSLKKEIEVLNQKLGDIQLDRDRLYASDQKRIQKIQKYKEVLKVLNSRANTLKNEKDTYFNKIQNLLSRTETMNDTQIKELSVISPKGNAILMVDNNNINSNDIGIIDTKRNELDEMKISTFNSISSEKEGDSSLNLSIYEDGMNNTAVRNADKFYHANNQNLNFAKNYVDSYTDMNNDKHIQVTKEIQTDLSMMKTEYDNVFKDSQTLEGLVFEYKFLIENKFIEELGAINEAEIIFLSKIEKNCLEKNNKSGYGYELLDQDMHDEEKISKSAVGSPVGKNSCVKSFKDILEETDGHNKVYDKDTENSFLPENHKLLEPIRVFGNLLAVNRDNKFTKNDGNQFGSREHKRNSLLVPKHNSTPMINVHFKDNDNLSPETIKTPYFNEGNNVIDDSTLLSVVDEAEEQLIKKGRFWANSMKNNHLSAEKKGNEILEYSLLNPLSPINAKDLKSKHLKGTKSIPDSTTLKLQDGSYTKKTIRVSIRGKFIEDDTKQAEYVYFANVKDNNRKLSKYLNYLINSHREIDKKLALVRIICLYKTELQRVYYLSQNLENLRRESDQKSNELNKIKESYEDLKNNYDKLVKKNQRCPFCGVDESKTHDDISDDCLSNFMSRDDEGNIPLEESAIKEPQIYNKSNSMSRPIRPSSKRRTEFKKKTMIKIQANKIFQLGRKNILEKRENPSKSIIEKLKGKNVTKFKNFMPIKQVLKLISQIYEERTNQSKESLSIKEEELSSFVFYTLLQQFGFKKLAQQKLIVFILSIKKYLHIIRINLFAKFMGLLDSKLNYTLEEFNKYIEGLEYMKNSVLGSPIVNIETETKHYSPYVRFLDYVKYFAESKLNYEELQEFKKEFEVLKENDPKNINRIGIIDTDLAMIKVLNKYRLICNRTKNYVVNAFQASDLDRNKLCTEQEFLIMYKCIEEEKYDEQFVKNLFRENYDIEFENQRALSFDKFTIVCVEYSLFSDQKQDQFLGISNKNDIIEKMEDLKFRWIWIKNQMEIDIQNLKKIDEKHKNFIIHVLEKLNERVCNNNISNDDYKPLLIAYKMLNKEIENLKEAEISRIEI